MSSDRSAGYCVITIYQSGVQIAADVFDVIITANYVITVFKPKDCVLRGTAYVVGVTNTDQLLLCDNVNCPGPTTASVDSELAG